MNWIRCYLFPKKNVNPPATQTIVYTDVDTLDKDTSAKAARGEIGGSCGVRNLLLLLFGPFLMRCRLEAKLATKQSSFRRSLALGQAPAFIL